MAGLYDSVTVQKLPCCYSTPALTVRGGPLALIHCQVIRGLHQQVVLNLAFCSAGTLYR